MEPKTGAVLGVLILLLGIVVVVDVPPDPDALALRFDRSTRLPGETFERFGGEFFAVVRYDDPQTTYAVDFFLLYEVRDRLLRIVVYIEGADVYRCDVGEETIRKIGRIMKPPVVPRFRGQAPEFPKVFV